MSPSGPDAGNPFAGDGEIRALAREKDWSSTSLGPVDGWSHTLRTTVRACLDSPFPINLWCGPELVLIYNDAYRHVLGDKHPESFARPGDEVWSEIWDDIASMFEQIRSGGPPIYADDAPFLIERTNGGEERDRTSEPNAWFTFALSGVRDEKGEIVAFLNIVSESTGRILAERAREEARARAERAEARLLDVFAQAPAFMAVVRGSDHVFEYVNNAYYELVGRRELLNRPVLEALPELRGQGFESLLDRVLETGEPYVGREVSVDLSRSERGQTEQRFVDFVYYPLTDADGNRSGVVAHGSDVTAHVRAREDAHAARKEAEEANQAKSRFLASMSHELRTPINAVLGYTELLEMEIPGSVNERQKAHLARIRSSSRHLLMLIEDILDLTKVEAGRLEVRKERIPVEETVSAALSLVTPQAGDRDIRIEAPPPSGPSPTFVGDKDRVRQILVNLLSNAVKFTEPGGQIRISHGTSDAPPSDPEAAPMTYIAVADTGIGIEPGEIEGLFEPFTQGEAEETRSHGGTGLGLAISRKLAELMGGRLTAESEPGQGSTFTLWLPDREASPARR